MGRIALTVAVVIWALAMWYAVIHVFVRAWGPYMRSKRQKKIAVPARIASKQGRHEMNPVTWEHEYTQKVLVFECEDGLTRDYEVSDHVWDWVEQGDDGVLTYQGDLFVCFDARRPRHNLDDMYKKLTRI